MTTVTEDVKEILASADVGMAVSGLDPARYQIERRDGSLVKFKGEKIVRAITKAFLAEENLSEPTERILEEVGRISDTVFDALLRRRPNGGTWHIEDIQDQVELALMRVGRPEVAKRYVLYRQERAKQRAAGQIPVAPTTPVAAAYTVTNAAGRSIRLSKTAPLRDM